MGSFEVKLTEQHLNEHASLNKVAHEICKIKKGIYRAGSGRLVVVKLEKQSRSVHIIVCRGISRGQRVLICQ